MVDRRTLENKTLKCLTSVVGELVKILRFLKYETTKYYGVPS